MSPREEIEARLPHALRTVERLEAMAAEAERLCSDLDQADAMAYNVAVIRAQQRLARGERRLRVLVWLAVLLALLWLAWVIFRPTTPGPAVDLWGVPPGLSGQSDENPDDIGDEETTGDLPTTDPRDTEPTTEI